MGAPHSEMFEWFKIFKVPLYNPPIQDIIKHILMQSLSTTLQWLRLDPVKEIDVETRLNELLWSYEKSLVQCGGGAL